MPRPFSSELRGLYLVAAVLAAGAAFLTFVLTERTADFFAWPIDPPLTAAWLGATYCAATVALSATARSRSWVEARWLVPTVTTISVLLLAATLIHLNRFDEQHPVFWFWLIAYAAVPPAAILLTRRQLAVPGEDGTPALRLPSWIRTGLAAQGAILLVFGTLLFALPGASESIWPWQLTELTSQALGAFVIGFGVSAAVLLRDDELTHMLAPGLAFAALAGGQLIAVARYGGDLDFSAVGAWIYLGFIAVGLGGALALIAAALRARHLIQDIRREDR